MSPKRRIKNKHLPPCIYYQHNAYYFVKNGAWTKIGKTLVEAMHTWATMKSIPESCPTMNQLFDRYMLEVAPLKAPATYKTNLKEVERLRAVFGASDPQSITATQIYRYLDERGKEARVRANREKGLLSHVFSMAIKWGIVNANPCLQVSRLKEKPRDRYVTDQEFLAVRALASPLVQCIMDFAYITALRQTDILKVKLSDLKEDGIFVEISKTKKKILIEWENELQEVVNRCRAVKRKIKGMALFCNHKGQPYTPSGFRALWQRIMVKALADGKIKERFHFHDLRRKAATDTEKMSGREAARKLLGHATQKMTGNYISGIQAVTPLKRRLHT